MSVRVLLIDDHAEFSESATRFLSANAGLDVAGHIRTEDFTTDRIAELRPDLLLIDWSLPVVNGPTTIRRLKTFPQSPKIILLTMYDSTEYHDLARLLGADGFVAKSEFGATLPPMIRKLFGQRAEAAAKGTANNPAQLLN